MSTYAHNAIRAAYDAAQASLSTDGPLKGVLFWEWVADGQTPSTRGVKPRDSTWGCGSLIKLHDINVTHG